MKLPRALRHRWTQDVLVAVLPAACVVVISATGEGGARALFEGLTAGLVVGASLGAFGGRVVVRAPAAALFVGLVAGSVAAGWLALAVIAAAAGLASLGRLFGAPPVPAGAVALGILVLAMGGLFWADPVAAHLPRAHRHAFRQAALDVDPSLAAAYDGAGFDRMRAEDVYFRVPLASGLIRAPRASQTGGLWLVVGLVAGVVAWRLGRRGKRGAAALDGYVAGREGERGEKRAGAARRPT